MAPEFKKNKTPKGGTDYELKLQTLFALAGFQHFENNNWKQSNENDQAGKFDDLVLQTDLGDVLLQAKHKDQAKLNDEHFLTTNPNNNDFSLAKYILSYTKQFVNSSDFNIKFLVLCTNADVTTSLFTKATDEECEFLHKIFEKCDIKKIEKTSMVQLLGKIITDYKIKLKDNQEFKNVNVEEENIQQFISKFICVTLKDGHMENLIRQKIEAIVKTAKNFKNASYKYVVDQILQWHDNKPSKAQYMTQFYVRSILYGEKNIREIESGLNETILFDNLYSFDTLNIIKPSEIRELRVNKVLQSIWMPYKKEQKLKETFYNETLLLNAVDFNEDELVIDCFLLTKYKYLLILFQKTTSKDKIFDKVFSIVNATRKEDKKKVIFLLDDDSFPCDKRQFKIIEDKISFKSFTSETQNRLLEREIFFQGMIIKLKSLCCNLDVENTLDEFTIAELLSSKNYYLGLDIKRLGSMRNYYIKRTLSSSRESFYEEDVLEKCPEKVLVISDEPGSGKSTLLIHLANHWKEQYPQLWILQLDIGVTVSNYKKGENRSLLEILQLHSRDKNHFETQLLRCLKKFIIFDGIDEISSQDRKVLLSFIKKLSLSTDVAKIIITSRSYNFILDELTCMDDNIFLTLEDFSIHEQAEFFKKYFNTLSITDAETFVKTLPEVIKHFLSIPLYIEMVAEIFSDKIRDQQLLQDVNIETGNTYKLFELFLEKKKKLFIRNKGNDTRETVLTDILSDSFERYLEDLEILAMRTNFLNSKKLELFDADINKKIKDSVLHVGILEQVNKDPRFVHKTFEEYFTAKYLWKQLIRKKVPEEFLQFLYKDVFLNMEKQNICHFIDCILENECHTRFDDITGQFGVLISQSTHNEHKNIMNLASQGSVNILKLILDKCENVSSIINNKSRHGETALLLSAHHLPTIKYLVEKGANINCEDDNGFAALHYATTTLSNFENFGLELTALSTSLHYRDMLFHMHSVHNNIYRYKELDNYIKKVNSNYQKGLILQRHSNNFNEIVKYFLNKGANLNGQTKIGTAVLNYVAYCGLYEEFKFLVEIGANVNIKDTYGNNIVHYAVLGGSVEIIEYLHSLDVYLNEANSSKVAPIHFSPIGNSLDVVLFLINHGVDIETEDVFGRTVLFYVNSATSLQMFELFVNLGIKIDRKSKDLLCNILHTASFTNAVHIVKYLMELDRSLYSGDQLGQYPEHYAAEGNSLKVLKYFQETYNSVTKMRDLEGSSALHLAAIGDAVNVVMYLVEELGMDPNLPNNLEKAPIHYAAGSGSFKIMYCLNKFGIDMNVRDKDGAGILHYAAAFGSLDIFKYLIRKISSNVSLVDNIGRHAIHYAAENDSLEIIIHLLKSGVDKHFIDLNGDNILHRAAIGKAFNVTKYIFENHSKLYVPNFNNKNPLHYAVEADALKIAKYFIRNGMNANVMLKNNLSLLHLAAGRDSINVVKFFIEEYKVNRKQLNKDGKTCVHFAAQGDSLKVIKYLDKIGFDFEETDNDNVTVVHCAALGNATNALGYFIDKKHLSFTTRDSEGRFPLHFACKTNAMQAINYLVQNNANIYSRDYRNNTVLHYCAEGNALNAFIYFVKTCRFGNMNVRELSGEAPIHVAIKFDFIEIVEFILNCSNDDYIDKYGNTILHFAVMHDSINVIKYLVNELNMSADIANAAGDTSLDFAVQYKSKKAIKFFQQPSEKKKCKVM